MTHSELVDIAGKWLKRQGCNVVLLERFAGNDNRGECPDAIGWWCSGFDASVIECKVSLSDFLADGKKPWRFGPAMGAKRWFLVPVGLFPSMEMLPERWGLLEWTGRMVKRRIDATRFPPYMRDTEAEAKLLLAELRIFHARGITYPKLETGNQASSEGLGSLRSEAP
jgi:hypothetical protein